MQEVGVSCPYSGRWAAVEPLRVVLLVVQSGELLVGQPKVELWKARQDAELEV